MKFTHVMLFTVFVGVLLAGNFYFKIISPIVIAVIIGLPALLGGLMVGKEFFSAPEINNLGTAQSLSPGSGTFYDTAIEPDEAWRFVNKRIDELEITPYRKIDTDVSNRKANQKIDQETIPTTLNGRETRITMIKGRPKNPRAREMLAFVVDLAQPSIHDYRGDLESQEERENPFNGKYGFHMAVGGNSEAESQSGESSPYVQINENNKGEADGA